MYGHRGSIMAHFGWTWEYICWGIRWAIVQRMLIDAPNYETEKEKDKAVRLTNENGKSLANYINSIKI